MGQTPSFDYKVLRLQATSSLGVGQSNPYIWMVLKVIQGSKWDGVSIHNNPLRAFLIEICTCLVQKLRFVNPICTFEGETPRCFAAHIKCNAPPSWAAEYLIPIGNIEVADADGIIVPLN